MKKFETIMLIDDNKADNLFHRVVIKKSRFAGDVVIFQYAEEALSFLQSSPKRVDLILLDINMPRMNGFEFLENYHSLEEGKKAQGVVIMLTTSLNPEDELRAKRHPDVKGFMNKPLTAESFQEIILAHFAV